MEQAVGSLSVRREESPGSTGQGAGVKPGRGDPADRAATYKVVRVKR